MTDLDLYISRKSAEKFLANFGQALKQPEAHPLVFNAHGIGGVGKSTLLEKLRQTYAKEAKFAKAFFGPTSKIDSPLKLMEHLYKQLPDDEWGGDAFTDLCKKYKETLNKLETEDAEGNGCASSDQVSLVKKLLGGAVKIGFSCFTSDQAAERLGNVAEGIVDVASLALSEKDRIEQYLKQHRATKNKRDLQELMLDPMPKLTQAFAEGVIQKSKLQPIVLELDTYEKASSEFDVFLCKYLLGDTALQSYPVRIVMAGRYFLKNKRYQRMFQQKSNLIYECHLEKFDKDETKRYLKKIGVTQHNEVRRLIQTTKGLPYFLKLIKDQKEDGRSPNVFRNSDEIVDRLLDGLTPMQKKVVQLASYCRWFDRPLIQYLINANLANKSQLIEEDIDWFDWLIERDLVIAEANYRVDDVARDVIRAAEHRADEQNFRHINDLLAQYFQQLANQEVAPEQPAPAKYENSDWRRHVAESTYYALFANRDKGQFQLLTHFFEGAHFEKPDIALATFTAVAAEAEPTNNVLLPKDTQHFLDDSQFAIVFGWSVFGKNPERYEFNLEESGSANNSEAKSIKPQIESALGHCFQKVDRLMGLAKYAGLMSQVSRCHSRHRPALIQQAREETDRIATSIYPQFSSSLLCNIADAFESVSLYQEALDSYDKAIKLNPNAHEAWNNRGLILQELKRYEQALDSYDKAIKLNPNSYAAWNNQGLVLRELKRYEQALSNFDKAIELEPDFYIAWGNRGLVLEELERYEQALSNFDKAVELRPDDHRAWLARGDLLRKLKQYKAALTNLDQALQITDEVPAIWNSRGLCLSFLGQYEEAINNLIKARKLNKEEPMILANQGIVLARAKRYEEAFAFCERALTLKENEAGYYAQACCHALQGDIEQAIDTLKQAIKYEPYKCRREAKCNPDFDSLRNDERFKALIEVNEK